MVKKETSLFLHSGGWMFPPHTPNRTPPKKFSTLPFRRACVQKSSTSYDRRQPPAPAECPLQPELNLDEFETLCKINIVVMGLLIKLKRVSTDRRALLKAVSKFSSERGPLVPTQILWKQFCMYQYQFSVFSLRINTFVFDIKCTKILYSGHFSAKHTCYSMPNLVEKIVRKECMSESPNNSQHANEKCN